jgi:hypothetical protein|tara:strand:+ start:6282 stop:6398 length:117 start_codon:yes stop_codon:yes gene_type:complete
VIPLVYHVSEAEILTWKPDKALRRYDLALQRLNPKRRG